MLFNSILLVALLLAAAPVVRSDIKFILPDRSTIWNVGDSVVITWCVIGGNSSSLPVPISDPNANSTVSDPTTMISDSTLSTAPTNTSDDVATAAGLMIVASPDTSGNSAVSGPALAPSSAVVTDPSASANTTDSNATIPIMAAPATGIAITPSVPSNLTTVDLMYRAHRTLRLIGSIAYIVESDQQATYTVDPSLPTGYNYVLRYGGTYSEQFTIYNPDVPASENCDFPVLPQPTIPGSLVVSTLNSTSSASATEAQSEMSFLTKTDTSAAVTASGQSGVMVMVLATLLAIVCTCLR